MPLVGESSGTPSSGPRWRARLRPLAFLILLGVTLYGLREFLSGDWRQAAEYWRAHLAVLGLVLLLACLDVACEAAGGIAVYERFGIRARDRAGICAFLSARAGLLLPAQLGRLIRPDAYARLGRGSSAGCLKAEAVAFALNAASVLALLAGLVAFRIHPVLGPVVGAATIAALLLSGNRLSPFLAGTRLALPSGFWWRGSTAAIVLVQMAGWIAHALGLYVMVRGLNPLISLWDPLFLAPASSLLGAGTGLPGGVGATEGLLGASLEWMRIPKEHLLLAVGAFRVVTFWVWIPVGWMALAFVRRGAARRAAASGGVTRRETSLPSGETGGTARIEAVVPDPVGP